MEEANKRILQEDELAAVAGGAFGDLISCPVCGKLKREGYICIHCDMADGVVACHRCRGRLTKEAGCSNCGATWDDYVRVTKPLRGE